MNRIVREHYPASKLPDDLRKGIDPDRSVTVTVVEEEVPPERPMTAVEWRCERRNPRETVSAILERHNLPKRSTQDIDEEINFQVAEAIFRSTRDKAP